MGCGVFHPEGWWPKTSCPPSKVCLPWVSKRGIWDVPGILPGCPGPLLVLKKFVQKNFVRIFRSLLKFSHRHFSKNFHSPKVAFFSPRGSAGAPMLTILDDFESKKGKQLANPRRQASNITATTSQGTSGHDEGQTSAVFGQMVSSRLFFPRASLCDLRWTKSCNAYCRADRKRYRRNYNLGRT